MPQNDLTPEEHALALDVLDAVRDRLIASAPARPGRFDDIGPSGRPPAELEALPFSRDDVAAKIAELDGLTAERIRSGSLFAYGTKLLGFISEIAKLVI